MAIGWHPLRLDPFDKSEYIFFGKRQKCILETNKTGFFLQQQVA